MATWDDVSRLALALPEAIEADMRGQRAWRVHDKLFVWERPLRGSDLRALGDAAPDGPILGARVEHLVAKEALHRRRSRGLLHDPAFRRLSRRPDPARADLAGDPGGSRGRGLAGAGAQTGRTGLSGRFRGPRKQGMLSPYERTVPRVARGAGDVCSHW